MNFSKFKIYIIMLAVGFLCVVLDFDVDTPFHYPTEYANSKQIIGEFQYYNIASNYNAYCDYKWINASGNDDTIENIEAITEDHSTTAKVINNIYYKNLQIDIFSDFLGFLFMIIACLGLRKCSRGFSFGAFASICAFIIHGLIVALPFFMNGLALCYFVFFTHLAYLACSIVVLYLIAKGLFMMCPDISCRDERKWCKILLFIISTAHILVNFMLWIGADFNMLYNLGIAFQYINGIFVLSFWRILYRTKDHLEKSYIKSFQ